MGTQHGLQDDDDIWRYVERLKKELSCQTIEKPIYNYSNFDDVNKYMDREIINTCHQFPKEWTVIQLCKNYNPKALSSKFEDICNYSTGISMTIFKHSAVKEMLMIEIKKQTHFENIFEKVYKLNKKICENLNYRLMPQETPAEKKESKEKYWNATKELDLYIQDIVNLLKLFIGPWICALTGNFKNRKSIETENEIRKKVYEFLGTRNFNDQQQKLIHLLARRTDLLSHQQIFVAITYILRDKPNLGYSDTDLNDLYDYLTWIKQEFRYDDTTTHPCIIIVDEFLDQMPFEMINTHQEFTRVCSFSNLKRLWERYCGHMDGHGYLVCPTNNCQAIVNPDNTLKYMEVRMRSFFNYWLPSWKVAYNQMPSKEDFYETLSQSDVLAYCGHGSGLQMAFCENIYNLKTNAVVFLFGCSSVALNSSGLNSELKGAHTFYHIGWSPVVIGFLWTVTDFNTDYCSSKILSAWINGYQQSQKKPHFQLVDKQTWRKTGNLGEHLSLMKKKKKKLLFYF